VTPPRLIQVTVKPRARQSTFVPAANGSWRAELKAPPVDGKANDELIALVANYFGCRKSAVSLKSGASSRIKLVTIEV